MLPKKKWQLTSDTKFTHTSTPGKIVQLILKNRNILSSGSLSAFLHPQLQDLTPENVGIDPYQLSIALKRIQQAIKKQEQIVVFGDYDVDGITASAILWETLFALGANVHPFIPGRKDEGYGLSLKALQNPLLREKKPTLIITVDNGIVANQAVAAANEQGIDVIITDHHTIGEALPDAVAIVHTTQLCGAGIAYLLSLAIRTYLKNQHIEPGSIDDSHLELAALGTVADLVPLVGGNRIIVKEGLQKLQKTQRIGLNALFAQAGVIQEKIGVYEIGFGIGPRLNASGRIASAMDSLRLLCTKDVRRATSLAATLEATNKQRQQLLKEAAEHAIQTVEKQEEVKKLVIIGHESYEEGIIGLIAGRLVEAFYRPAIVLAIGKEKTKASVRSVSGFNIIEFLRSHQEQFINVGGHPMAAGFTIKTERFVAFKTLLEQSADALLTEETLTRRLVIDCELPFACINHELYAELQQLAPFGMGNPEPVFMTTKVSVASMRLLGKERNHLKLLLDSDGVSLDAIGFGMGEVAESIKVGDQVNIAYTIDENTWNGNTTMQLKLRDIILS